MNLQGKTAFVTGGSGFIGGRLIEVLRRQYGMRVKALVRGTTSAGGGAFRAAAAGAEIVFGSLMDEAVLSEALAGCDLVFHCAYGTHGSAAEQRTVTVDGARLLAQGAAKAGVGHFVHLGTVSSYGGGNTPAVVEADYVNPKLWAWPYAHDKLDGEAALGTAARAGGMPYTILRLGSVYGPYGASFTTGPLHAMRVGRLAMVDQGEGLTSAVYVDDVIQAMLLAAAKDGSGQTYMVRGPDNVSWRDFYGAYDAMLGLDSLVGMSRAEMNAARRGVWRSALRKVVPEALVALKASPSFRAAAGALPLVRTAYSRFGRKLIKPPAPSPAKRTVATDDRGILLVPEPMIDYFSNPSIFSIEKARNELGYQPIYSLKDGMALTEQWARWANLIP
ncbi:MAG: oxidoreductase [Sphingomonas bacterium]|uniref:NAD-dependent epimerase/dehydratase family protein n=1 Tax=Sphingomonas bacterium TaxID=1895847 RepID=UPI002628007D|nr:NAD-dependent epimerase/dehydratase family protein [Sphingomonas bacterium]MDB5711484.1 oxidoreductase [Sphingomonas bacterium]